MTKLVKFHDHLWDVMTWHYHTDPNRIPPPGGDREWAWGFFLSVEDTIPPETAERIRRLYERPLQGKLL